MFKICFVFQIEALFSRSPKIFFEKKKKSGQKVLFWLVKYISVDQKESFIDTCIY